MQQSSLSLRAVIEQVSQEKGIDPKVLIEATEQAILTAAKRTFGADRELEARFNEETGTVDLFQYMTVVEEVTDEEQEISHEAALRHGLEADIGEELGFIGVFCVIALFAALVGRALRTLRTARLHEVAGDTLLAFSKTAHGGPSTDPTRPGDASVLVVVNLNPFEARETMVHVPLARIGLGSDESYIAHDLLTGTSYTWRAGPNYVRLDPQGYVCFVIVPFVKTPEDAEQSASLYRRLLELNQSLLMAKFSIDDADVHELAKQVGIDLPAFLGKAAGADAPAAQPPAPEKTT